MEDEKVVVGYYRISMEDEDDKQESNSITNQRLLIKDYVDKDEELSKMQFIELYDDGYSGTNMNRPGMQQLIEMIKSKRVECIVVKDFSRFARNYIELGTYMDQIFPLMGIRFISISDNYDGRDYQNTGSDLSVQFKGLLADFYTKDISNKTRSAIKAKCENGMFCFGTAPFGYERNPKNKYELIIVEEEAAVVRRVFDLTLKRYTKKSICCQLNEEGYKTPYQVRQLRKNDGTKCDNTKFSKWTGDMVRTILRNRAYTGDMVYGKTEMKEIGSNQEKAINRSNWKIYENHHEAIVSREDFESVQRMWNSSQRAIQKDTSGYLLKGKVFCGNCLHTMAKSKAWKGSSFFRCNYAKYEEDTACFAGHIDNAVLEQLVLEALKQEIGKFAERFHLDEDAKASHSDVIKSYQSEIIQNEQTIADSKEKKKKDFEAYHDGSIMREAFIKQKKELDTVIELSEKRIESLKEMLTQEEHMLQYSVRSDEELLQYAGYGELTADMVAKYVDKVLVNKNGKIDIFWKFDEELYRRDSLA